MDRGMGPVSTPDRLVVALGGNTLLGAETPWTAEQQRSVIKQTADTLAASVSGDTDIVLTHGNGPQVGARLLQQEAAPETPRLSLDVLVAETQAQIGYLLQQALDNALATPAAFMTIVTQVVVDPDDPAFEAPTKPIGPTYSDAEATEVPFKTHAVADGHRRVVPSPEPQSIVEGDEIARLVDAGRGVICAGGGGVPVVRDDGLRGVEAVVDKDKTSARLARTLAADALVILTDVPYAYLDYGGPTERPLETVTPTVLREHLAAGAFPAGSMGPKVTACCRFVEDTGNRAIITTPEDFADALAGEAGTQVCPA